MTRQESFKRRIRTRMEKTGERYAAARQALIDRAELQGSRVWVSDPDITDNAIQEATGRGWDQWCDLIEGWPGSDGDHAAVAAHLREKHDVDPWWAQSITVGYERITGRRLPYQRPDGTFTASCSRTLTIDGNMLNALLRDAQSRGDLFPGHHTELRSNPTSKTARIGIGPGVAVIAIEPKPNGRCRVSVSHERLRDFDEVTEWKFYWSEWLDAIEGTRR